MFVNKIILKDTNTFLLFLVQNTVSLCLLLMCNSLGLIKISFKFTWGKLITSLFSIINILLGMVAVSKMNMVMFVTLRRGGNLLTMWIEILLIKKYISKVSQLFVYIMVIGGLIAAYNDFELDIYGFIHVMLCNITTTTSQILIKKYNYDISTSLFYNSLFGTILSFVLIFLIPTHPRIKSLDFSLLILSPFLGLLVNYGSFWCMQMNSATTFSMVGSTKNIIMGLLSILIDHHKNNFLYTIGIIISFISSVSYLVVT